jgi:hypothetical protein
MTQSFEYKQSYHLNPALTDPATRTLNADKLTGRWINTDAGTKGLAEILIERDGEPQVQRSWVERTVQCLAEDPGYRTGKSEEEAGQRALLFAVTRVWP